MPTTQFHDYQPPDTTPNSDRDSPVRELLDFLRRLGIAEPVVDDVRKGLRQVGVSDASIHALRDWLDQDLTPLLRRAGTATRKNRGWIAGAAVALAGAGIVAILMSRR